MLHQSGLPAGLVLLNPNSAVVMQANSMNMNSNDMSMANHAEYRKPNFSDREKLFLINQVRQHQNRCRADGKCRLGLRKNAWESICQALNEYSPHVQRTVREVNKKWRNLAFSARRESACYKAAKQENPSSTNIRKISETNQMILEILKAEEQGNVDDGDNAASDSESVIFEDEIEFEEDNSCSRTVDSNINTRQMLKYSPPSSPYKCEINLDPSIIASDLQSEIFEQQVVSASAVTPWTIQSVQSLSVRGPATTPSPPLRQQPSEKRIRLYEGCQNEYDQSQSFRNGNDSAERDALLAFERERLKLEKERLEIERERLKIEKEKMSIEAQKFQLEKTRRSLKESRGSSSDNFTSSSPESSNLAASSGNALLIKGGKVVNDDDMFLSDVLVQDGKIKEVGVNLSVPKDVKVIDARGKLVIPGGIDTHTHMQAYFMGTYTVDDFFTGTRAALAGGTTMIIDFAQDLKLFPLDIVTKYRQMADNKVCCDYGLHLIISQWNERVRQEMQVVVKERGVNSFKMFMAYKDIFMLKDDELLECFDTCAKVGALAMVHAENGDVIYKNEKKVLGLGITGPEGHLFSRPEDIEAEATHRAIVLGEHVNCPVYVVHVMSKSAANIITMKKKEGCVVFGEPIAAGLGTDGSHYFDRCWRHAACHILSPPLRNDPTTPAYLMDKLSIGDLECTGTDHCCFTSSQKAMGADDFTKIPNGINGVQERMAVIWEKGVVTGKLTPSRFVAVTSTNAAKVFNIYPQKGRIQVGSDADIVVWDPEKKQVISTKTHLSAGDFNIFDGMELHGVPLYVITRGVVAVDNGQVNVTAGSGQFVPMAPFCSYVYDRVNARAKANTPKKVERKPYKAQ